MSDSKQAIRVLGGQGTSPDVINSAPAGTEKGWAVWVVNPSAGGGTVDQGKAGTSGESWYVRDGSGLLSTAAKQDAGNSILTSIDGKLTGPLSVTGTISATQGTSPWVVSLASLALDSNGRVKEAGVANFQYITAAGTYPLKTSAGILRYIAITAKFSAGSLSVFNDNNATTNPIAGFDLNVNFFWPLNQVCSNGITVVTGAGFNGQIAVGWD